MRQSFSSSMVSEVVGVSLRQLDYWARTGLLRPTGVEAAGKGSRRSYTFHDIIALMAIRGLRQGNCPLQKVRAAVDHLRQSNPEQNPSHLLAKLTLLTDGKHVYVFTKGSEIMEVVSRQMVWSVPLGKLVQEAIAKVEELPSDWEEVVKFNRQHFHLDYHWDKTDECYRVECRELPGLKCSGKDALEVGNAVREKLQTLASADSSSGLAMSTTSSLHRERA